MAKSREPEENIGIYKHLSDVPGHYRLSNFESEYQDRDVRTEYTAIHHPDVSARTVDRIGRFEERWKDHMADRGRHHALATPDDVDEFCTEQLENMAIVTLYSYYWKYLETFYSWLQSSTEHPHVFHPPIMAAVEYPNARAVWDRRIQWAVDKEY